MLKLSFKRTMSDVALGALFGPIMPARVTYVLGVLEVEELVNVISGVLTFRCTDGALVGVPCETISAVEAL